MDKGSWQATIHEITEPLTWLSDQAHTMITAAFAQPVVLGTFYKNCCQAGFSPQDTTTIDFWSLGYKILQSLLNFLLITTYQWFSLFRSFWIWFLFCFISYYLSTTLWRLIKNALLVFFFLIQVIDFKKLSRKGPKVENYCISLETCLGWCQNFSHGKISNFIDEETNNLVHLCLVVQVVQGTHLGVYSHIFKCTTVQKSSFGWQLFHLGHIFLR